MLQTGQDNSLIACSETFYKLLPKNGIVPHYTKTTHVVQFTFDASLVTPNTATLHKWVTVHLSTTYRNCTAQVKLVGWLEFNVPFQHKYGYIRDEHRSSRYLLSSVLYDQHTGGDTCIPGFY